MDLPDAFEVTVKPGGEHFPVPGGDTLLAAAERAGVAWQSSCRAGTCRQCMARCLEGRARHTIEWPGLIPEEKAQGFILPCVAVAETNLVLERAPQG